MIDMVKKGVIPSVLSWQNALLDVLTKKKAVGLPLDASLETAMLEKVSALSASLAVRLSELENAVLSAKTLSNALETARYFRNHVYSAMGELRITVDELETLVGREYWAYPTYGELLYSVN